MTCLTYYPHHEILDERTPWGLFCIVLVPYLTGSHGVMVPILRLVMKSMLGLASASALMVTVIGRIPRCDSYMTVNHSANNLVLSKGAFVLKISDKPECTLGWQGKGSDKGSPLTWQLQDAAGLSVSTVPQIV